MGWLDISHVPPSLVLLVIFLSLLVGLATGIYPAQRAKKISALDALRYE
jgi:ABC-type antimicrobial peptide transport system permease subunit